MTDTQVLAALVGGRKLIERPQAWAQGATHHWRGEVFARCAGQACSDALGATDSFYVIAAGTDPNLTVLGQAMNELRLALPVPWREVLPTCGAVSYNDDHSTTHADILALFDTAIGRVRARVETTELSLGLRSHPSVTLEPYEGLLATR